jgi:hypothetical protein
MEISLSIRRIKVFRLRLNGCYKWIYSATLIFLLLAGHKRMKSTKNKSLDHLPDDYDPLDDVVMIEGGLTTSSSLSGGGGSGSVTKRNQKESPNRRLDNPQFPGETSSSSSSSSMLSNLMKWSLLLTSENKHHHQHHCPNLQNCLPQKSITTTTTNSRSLNSPSIILQFLIIITLVCSIHSLIAAYAFFGYSGVKIR